MSVAKLIGGNFVLLRSVRKWIGANFDIERKLSLEPMLKTTENKFVTHSYVSILPNVVFGSNFHFYWEWDSEMGRAMYNVQGKSPLNKRSSILSLDFFRSKLPLEIRKMVYGYILGPVKILPSDWDENFDKPYFFQSGAVRVSRRLKPISEGNPASASEIFGFGKYKSVTSIYYAQKRRRAATFMHIPEDDYYDLESLVQRICHMERNAKGTLVEFLECFFKDVVVELEDFGLFQIDYSHKWIKSRPDLHPFIRNVSLGMDLRASRHGRNKYFKNKCKFLSRRLAVSNLTIHITTDMCTARDTLRMESGELDQKAIEACRKVPVREGFEVCVFLTCCEEKWSLMADDESERKTYDVLLKKMQAYLYKILLPYSLRSKADENDEYFGVSELFQENQELYQRGK